MDIQLVSETAQRTWDVARRARIEAALEQSEAKYRLLFESIDEGFCQIQLLYDAQGQPTDWIYLDANPTFERQVGVNPVGQTVSQVVGPVESFWLDFYHQVVMSQQAARTENYVAALDRWYTIYASPVGTSPDQLTVVFDDCSARKRLEASLRAADRRKDEFLAMLAHELRNPLATVRNGLNILTMLNQANPVAEQTMRMMHRQMDHLVRMVDDLLDVSRITQGKIELKRERLELGTLVSAVVEAIRPQYTLQQKDLILNSTPAPLLVHGDATRLTQVVTNLLTNGLRYTGVGGRVWLSLTEEGGDAILRVADNGIGLSADQRTAIFELFVQADTSLARSQGGLGVGLTLANRLVEMHGGRIEARSPGLGQGSEFRVHLPLLKESSQVSPTQVTSAASPVEGRILVIDDNADAALTLSMLLTLKGYDVFSRHSGQEGIQAAEAERPAGILCDISMPGMDGYETARRIRQQPWGQQMVLIALTGYGGEDDKQRAREAGFNGHLVKPVDLGALTALLRNLLSGA